MCRVEGFELYGRYFTKVPMTRHGDDVASMITLLGRDCKVDRFFSQGVAAFGRVDQWPSNVRCYQLGPAGTITKLILNTDPLKGEQMTRKYNPDKLRQAAAAWDVHHALIAAVRRLVKLAGGVQDAKNVIDAVAAADALEEDKDEA